jgi:hypothetical protein
MNDKEREQVIRVSTMLQPLAEALETTLAELAGETIGFVLVTSVANTAQYVSNVQRSDGTEMIRDLLARWEAKRADIPASYNPDLRSPLLDYDVTFIHNRERTEITFNDVPAHDPRDAEQRARVHLSIPDAWTCTSNPSTKVGVKPPPREL